MKVINATTIGNLIKAHMEGDEKKFLSYANFIQQSYEEEGDTLGAKIIRKSIDGSYKNESQVSLDSAENRCIPDMILTDFIIETMKKNRGKSGVNFMYIQQRPVVTIQGGIDYICEALPIYMEQEKKWDEEQKRSLEDAQMLRENKE